MGDMGTTGPLCQSVRPGQPIVAFDFDGTLTVRDSFTAYLRWRVGPERWRDGLIALTPALLAYVVDRDRQKLKSASIRKFLSHIGPTTVSAEAEQFAAEVWDRFMRPDALKVWKDWGARGAHRVIVTASPAVTVAPFARRLGAEALLGSELETDDRGWLTGAFLGPNCRGEEKVRRLRAAYGEDLKLAAAYGDTSGDTEMLSIAEQPGFRVFTARP